MGKRAIIFERSFFVKVKVKVLLLYSAARPDGFSSALQPLLPGRGLTQPWCEPSP